MLNVAIIIGSTRPGRKAGVVARWVYEIAARRSDASFEIVDIAALFRPRPEQQAAVNAMLDDLVAWGQALQAMRSRTTCELA